MRSSNPALRDKAFEGFYDSTGSRATPSGLMTINGTINKTGILLLLAVATAAISWQEALSQGGLVSVYTYGGAGVGFIFAMITIFKQSWAPVTAPIYALAEGFFLGGISAMMAMQYSGIVIQAVGLTFGTLFVMLAIYRSGLIKVTNKFTTGVKAATGSILLVYIVTYVLGFFGIQVPYIHSGGIIGIGFSLLVLGVASLNLMLDFDMIERYSGRAPKYMEWYGAFGLMVTLVWLYLEFLRLLAKLQSRD